MEKIQKQPNSGKEYTGRVVEDTPQIFTRIDTSRSLEDAERFRALSVLKNLGFLVPIDSLEMVHGRAEQEVDKGEWQVDPDYDNSRYNVYKRSMLYVGDRELADKFAQARVTSPGAAHSLYKVDSWDTDASIVDLNFDTTKLESDDKKAFYEALSSLLLPVTEGVPLSFGQKNDLEPIAHTIKDLGLKSGFITSKDISDICEASGVSKDSVLRVVSASNARQLMRINPVFAINKYLNTDQTETTFTFEHESDKGAKEEVACNLEYIERWMREARVVGFRSPIVRSATLGEKIEPIGLLDLRKVSRPSDIEKSRADNMRRFGAIAVSLDDYDGREFKDQPELLQLLSDYHAKPDKLVDAAMNVPGFGDLFSMDAGNWEGYTLAEHTETVLRNFDENFADNIPVQMLAPMRLAIIAHDIGKSVAASRGEKHLQKKYNRMYAEKFFDELGINHNTQELLLAIMAEGSDLAYEVYVKSKGDPKRAGSASRQRLVQLARDALNNFYGKDEVSAELIRGFVGMCKILQVCDGGAYTDMAITRSRQGKGRYRNHPTFNGSFKESRGFSNRRLSLPSEK